MTAAKPSGPAVTAGARAHEVRIIGGKWKRTRLAVADRPGLRPTPDRVRETLFNWLGQDLTGWRCADAFAGTGALGFEAASRGAREVILIELETSLVAQLRATQTRLDAQAVHVERGDAMGMLGRLSAASMDLVFLDPPFEGGFFEPALRAAVRVLAEGGQIYLEAPTAWDDPALAAFGLQRHRYLKAGAVHAHLLVRAAA